MNTFLQMLLNQQGGAQALPNSFVDAVANGQGWGKLAPISQVPMSEDDAGNQYAANGSIIRKGIAPGSMTWGETALAGATAPAKLATGLASTLSPYGSEGFQVPPILAEPVRAGNRLLNSGGFPDPQDPQNQQDAVTSLLSFFGANAFGGARAGAGAAAALSDTSRPSVMGSAVGAAEQQPIRNGLKVSGNQVARHPVFGHEMPLANGNQLTFETELMKIARGDTDLPMGGDFYRAAIDIKDAEISDLAAAFGGDTRKAKEFMRLLDDDTPSSQARFEALQAEAVDVPERVYGDRHTYASLATVFDDLERNAPDAPVIVNRFLADIPIAGKNPDSWSIKEQAAMAVMRKAAQESVRAGIPASTFSKAVAENYARQFRDPEDAKFMLDQLANAMRPKQKAILSDNARPSLLGSAVAAEQAPNEAGILEALMSMWRNK